MYRLDRDECFPNVLENIVAFCQVVHRCHKINSLLTIGALDIISTDQGANVLMVRVDRGRPMSVVCESTVEKLELGLIVHSAQPQRRRLLCGRLD